MFAQEGDDTVNANDGYADVISCGEGNDTANVDSTDFVQPDCEVVNRTERLSARDIPEDRPPAVTFTGPAANTTVPGRATLTAEAADDIGVARVLFLDEDQVVCSDDTAPYSCEYTAGGEDVGRKTLTAVAVDTIGQTASSNRTVFVPRFVPTISVGVSPRADRTFPFTFTVSGRLTPPAGVSNAAACRGAVVGADQVPRDDDLQPHGAGRRELPVQLAGHVPRAAPDHLRAA